jgi:hypothetical protein
LVSDWRSSAAGLALALLAALLPGAASAKVFLSKTEALEFAFPGADRVESRSVLLDAEQARAIESMSQAKLETKIVTLHTGWKDGVVQGYAFIDTQVVRTLPEACLIVLSPEGSVRSLRVLAFYEPEDYLPTERWLGQFQGHGLTNELALQRGIQGIAGATLSAGAITSGVRRALAFYSLVIVPQKIAGN